MDSKKHPPRCDEVTRELAAPSGALAPEAVAAHLASCPRCAAWDRRAAALDRAWEATRPAELPAARWNAVWAEVSRAAAERPAARPALTWTAPMRRPRPRVALMGAVAAAAALLVALFISARDDGPNPGVARTLPPTAMPDRHFEVEPGLLLTIRVDDQGVQADRRPQEQTSETETVPWDLELFNGVESITMAAQW